nr:NAD(P)-dependent oxidoreductase [Azospirillum cavernae]
MHVLVTGAGGLCGRHAMAGLLAAGHRVTAVVGRSAAGPAWSSMPESGMLDLLHGDLAGDLGLPRSFDAVVHTAARLPDPGVSTATLTHDNVLATRRLLAAAKTAGARRFVYFSSLSVYGRIVSDVVDERTAIDAPEPYGASKQIGEELVRACAGCFPSLALRLPGIIGPRSTRNWLSRVMEAACAGKEVMVFNPDTPFNNAVHVDDLTRFVVRLLGMEWDGADAVTLGADSMTTVLDAARRVVDGVGGDSKIVTREAPGAPRFTVSSRRAKALYGYAPMEIGPMLEQFVAENAADVCRDIGKRTS